MNSESMTQLWQQTEWEKRTLANPEKVAAREASFTALVKRQSRFVFQVAYALLRNVQDSEDVAQETFLKLYRTGAWERMHDERAYLARTAWRLAVEKASKRRQPAGTEGSVVPSVTPEQSAIENAEHAQLHQLIDSLPEELRQPLALSAIEELDSRAVAVALGIPEGTVRTRVMRARALLKTKLLALSGEWHG